MSIPDLSIVLVALNSADWLPRCLASIERERGELVLERILVDNASDDGSAEVALAACPGLRVLSQDINIGYVRACNLGMSAATGRYVMLLNNDVELGPDYLEPLVRHMDAHSAIGAISGRILNPDGTDQGASRSFPSVANGLFGRQSLLSRWFPRNPWTRRFLTSRARSDDAPFEVEIQSSCCLMMPRGLVTSLGGFDEVFDLYWADAELCTRIRRTGRSIVCLPMVHLFHHEGQGGSTRTLALKLRSNLYFHRDAYRAYVRVRAIPRFHLRRLLAATALAARLAVMTTLQIIRPGRATSSGKPNN